MASNELIKAGIKLVTAIFTIGFAGKVASEGKKNYQNWKDTKSGNNQNEK